MSRTGYFAFFFFQPLYFFSKHLLSVRIDVFGCLQPIGKVVIEEAVGRVFAARGDNPENYRGARDVRDDPLVDYFFEADIDGAVGAQIPTLIDINAA